MKKTLSSALVAVLFLTTVFFSACGSGQVTDTGTSKRPIKIGATEALTGPFAFFGMEEQAGYAIALEDLNASGGILGRKVEMIFEDNQGDTIKAVTSVRKMLEVDKVDFVFSAFTHITQAIEPVVTEAKKILIYASSTRRMAEESKYAFRDWVDNIESGIVLAKILKERGENKLAYIGEIDEPCELDFQALKDEGIKFLAVEKFQPGEKDLRTQLLRLKNSGATAFVMCDWRDANPTMKALKELGLVNVQTYHFVGHFVPHSNSPEMNAIWKENKTIDTWYGPSKNIARADEAVRIEKIFRERYNRSPLPEIWFTYDRLFMLKEAAESCGAIDQDCIADYLAGLEYEGVSGKVRFDEKGVSHKDVLIQQYGESGWEEIEQ